MFSSPKNLRKFRQPLDASRGHLTKSQLQKKNSSCPKHIVEHLACTVPVKVQSFREQFQVSVSFSSEPHVDLASNCSGALLPVPPSYPPRRTVAWRVAGVGGELAEVHRPVSGGSSTRCGCQRGAARDGAVQHRPSHQRPPRGRPLLCARCRAVVVNWEARSALPAAVVPVRPFRRGPVYYASPTEV